MSDLEHMRWNNRYDTSEYVFGQAPAFYLPLKAKHLAPGRALCVADGEGRNGVWLAEQGFDVVSLDFSANAQAKAAALAQARGVKLELIEADVHAWNYPTEAFDLVVDIYSQFSTPAQRPGKWQGMVKALKPGGHLILLGYTPKQLEYGTGGPKVLDQLYTETLLREAFSSLEIIELEASERELSEGQGHSGMSAVIGLFARKP